MKFITELTLRALYREAPFTEYELGEDARLTPGGRSFLSDRRIRLVEPEKVKRAVWQKQTQAAVKQAEEAADHTPALTIEAALLAARTRSLENLIFETGHGFLESDVSLAQSVMDLAPAVAAVRHLISGRPAAQAIACTACTKITPDNVDRNLGECFEMTPFHIQSKNGRQILKLDKLRCAVNELALLAESQGHGAEKEDGVGPRLNRVANLLSQMICTAFGGKECLRNE